VAVFGLLNLLNLLWLFKLVAMVRGDSRRRQQGRQEPQQHPQQQLSKQGKPCAAAALSAAPSGRSTRGADICYSVTAIAAGSSPKTD